VSAGEVWQTFVRDPQQPDTDRWHKNSQHYTLVYTKYFVYYHIVLYLITFVPFIVATRRWLGALHLFENVLIVARRPNWTQRAAFLHTHVGASAFSVIVAAVRLQQRRNLSILYTSQRSSIVDLLSSRSAHQFTSASEASERSFPPSATATGKYHVRVSITVSERLRRTVCDFNVLSLI